jgi:two-component system chemotaxis response regulator CheB
VEHHTVLTQSYTRRDHTTATRSESEKPAGAIVALAASAGGLHPLARILDGLPRDFSAAIVIAAHTGESSTLPALLQRRCRLPVSFVRDGEIIRKGNVYVAPPQAHLIVNASRRMSIVHKDRRQFARPSADWLFDTIAASYSDACVGVVLSGYRRDGARGVVRIRDAGGSTIAQDPASCEAPDMPTAAIRTGCVMRVLPPELIAEAIIEGVGALDVERRSSEFDDPFAATA